MKSSKDLFEIKSTAWDKNTSYPTEKILAMLTLADIPDHAIILDVGCGTGVLEPYLLTYNPSVILGVDFASNMIESARNKLTHQAVRFVCADILDISDLQCDCCILLNVFQHFTEPKKILKHINSLIKLGGRIIISHTQGRSLTPATNLEDRTAPAKSLRILLEKNFHIDTLIDSNAMLLISGIKIKSQ